MCHLFMKLSDTFDQNPLCTFDKIREKPILMKNALESKGQGHSRNQERMTWGTKNMPPKKDLSRECLSNWCDADTDADISKTICRPPPYGGVDIIINITGRYTWKSLLGVIKEIYFTS